MNTLKKVILFMPILLLMLLSCKTEPKAEKQVKNYAEELHSYARPNASVIKHLDLNITVNFEDQIIDGVATYT
ncbi:MAG: aminopeptidase, partial [Algicola sp.]|nr:aminopeptidase [Algicola sp.]